MFSDLATVMLKQQLASFPEPSTAVDGDVVVAGTKLRPRRQTAGQGHILTAVVRGNGVSPGHGHWRF